jgi:UDP-N-acetylenolpyruvoylglucosamine reductase
MIEAFIEYFNAQTRFEYDQSEIAGRHARVWLSVIRKEAFKRRAEIQEKRLKIRNSRKGKPGRPRKITKFNK